jgi:hypothetical protein
MPGINDLDFTSAIGTSSSISFLLHAIAENTSINNAVIKGKALINFLV